MFPKIANIDKISCLTSLVGIRTACTPDKNYPYWIEDIEELDVQKLSKVTRAASLKGEDYGSWLINSAAREMMGDLELLMNNGYTMNSTIGDMCSSCKLLTTYTANTGIMVKSATPSLYQVLNITRLFILANVTGEKQFVIDDGVDPKYYTVDLQAGVQIPVNLNYSTSERQAKIYFVDNTVPLGRVECPTTTSCGCGGSPTANNPLVFTGLLAGAENAVQYGFLACAGISCSYDALICHMIKTTPNIFGLALLYKIGDKFLIAKNQTGRNNDVAGFQDPGAVELQKNYGQLYWAKMKGTGNMLGLKNIVHTYLKQKTNDKCVVCDSKVYTASITG